MPVLALRAASKDGDCYPDGLLIADIFGTDDAAAAMHLAGKYESPGYICDVVQLDRPDEAILLDDDLADEDFDRLGRMNAVDWHRFEGGATAVADGHELIVDRWRGEWRGSLDGRPRFVCRDREQAEAKLAAHVYPARVVA